MTRSIPSRLFKLSLILVILGSIVFLILPGEAPARPRNPDPPLVGNIPEFGGLTDDDYRFHIEKLKKRLPGPGFTIVQARPFVVIGDESPEIVERRARDTVGWAVEKLKDSYFSRDPDHIIDVWLFQDKESYEQNVALLWNETPTTPFGYYSGRHNALVMNIATGGGTLVHEIVHPFMEANFPDCPDWFNEGLASLYEQCREEKGRIHGSTNWRLEGLQKAIATGRLQSFQELVTRDFYADDDGTNYAMARYLCYYLQQQGRLRPFYRDFIANVAADPTGYQTLQKTLGTRDMGTFQKKWEAYVNRLVFR